MCGVRSRIELIDQGRLYLTLDLIKGGFFDAGTTRASTYAGMDSTTSVGAATTRRRYGAWNWSAAKWASLSGLNRRWGTPARSRRLARPAVIFGLPGTIAVTTTIAAVITAVGAVRGIIITPKITHLLPALPLALCFTSALRCTLTSGTYPFRLRATLLGGLGQYLNRTIGQLLYGFGYRRAFLHQDKWNTTVHRGRHYTRIIGDLCHEMAAESRLDMPRLDTVDRVNSITDQLYLRNDVVKTISDLKELTQTVNSGHL